MRFAPGGKDARYLHHLQSDYGAGEAVVRDDETIGRPRGDAAFLAKIERKTGRQLIPAKRGPKPRESN